MGIKKGRLRMCVFLVLGLMFSDLARAHAECDIHPSYFGKWYSFENGQDRETTITAHRWGEYSCLEKFTHPPEDDAVEGRNITMLMRKTDGSNDCTVCVDVLWRTPKILQYHMSDCLTEMRGFHDMCGGTQKLPPIDQVDTLFSHDYFTGGPDCSSTWQGRYRFTYETSGGGGLCDSGDNIIRACRDPGSAYVDNRVFRMDFGNCPAVHVPIVGARRYVCMGSWYAKFGQVEYKFSAIADSLERDRREKFKCLMTRQNQNTVDNTVRWVMTRFPNCNSLQSLYEAPMRMVLRPIFPSSPDITPKCTLPSALSGSWYKQGHQVVTQVDINDTQIHQFTQCAHGIKEVTPDAEVEDFYLSCLKTSGTRFMMADYSKGKCEVRLVCYDVVPQVHGILRIQFGKHYQLHLDEMEYPNFLERKFEEVCSDQSFPKDRRGPINQFYVNRIY